MYRLRSVQFLLPLLCPLRYCFLFSRFQFQISIPLLIGFGVSSPDIARELATIADGVIVGSAIVNFVTQNFNKPQFLGDFAQYLSQYRQALGQLSENE